MGAGTVGGTPAPGEGRCRWEGTGPLLEAPSFSDSRKLLGAFL